MQPPNDPLDNLLDRWGSTVPPPPERLEPEVWRRIAVVEDADPTPGLFARIKAVFARPSFSIAFAAACALLGLFLVERHSSQQEARRNMQLVQSYVRLVDPLVETDPAATSPQTSQNLDELLVWMKNDLKLNDQQLARVKNVHEQLSPRLLTLARQVAQMQNEFAAFENTRKSVGQVDFVGFARYVDERRRLDRECADSTRRLVAEAADVMTPEQRQLYLDLLTPALKKSGVGSL